MKRLIAIFILLCSLPSVGQISEARKLLLSQGILTPYYVTHTFVTEISEKNIYASTQPINNGDFILLMAASKTNETLSIPPDINIEELEKDSSANISTIICVGFYKGADGTSFSKQVFGGINSNKGMLIVVFRNVNIADYNYAVPNLNQYYASRMSRTPAYVNDLVTDIWLDSEYDNTYTYSGTNWTTQTGSNQASGWTYGIGTYISGINGSTEFIYHNKTSANYISSYMIPLRR